MKAILIILIIVINGCQIDSPPQYYKPEKKELKDNGLQLTEVGDYEAKNFKEKKCIIEAETLI